MIKVDVLCVGHASYDIVFPVDRHPGEDDKCVSKGLIRGGGGPAANAAVTVARLGGTSAFAGYLGRDIFGEMHLEELVAEGVATNLIVRGDGPTPISSIIVKPDGKRTVVNYAGATPVLDPGEVDFSTVRPGTVLFDGHQHRISVPLAMEAKAKNIPAVLDAGSVHKGTVELAPLCRFLIASRKFARDFTGEKEPRAALELLARTAPVAVITLGEEGLIWSSGKESGRIDAFPVNTVDTTGAGDVFHGAFAFRITRGDGLLPALRYAGAAAAVSCLKMGARAGIPTAAEVAAMGLEGREGRQG